MSFLNIENLSKNFATTRIFSKLNFSINKGELVTLLGPSGCGKSTLIRTIAGLEIANSGKIELDNQDISQIKAKDRNIGMVMQHYALFPNLTVFENIAFGLKVQKKEKQLIKAAVNEMITMVALNGKEDHYPHQLSGGQQQRVALARTLVVKPKLLLLDEPLSALDAKIRKNLRTQIKNIQQELNLTTIFITHDQEEALSIADKVFIMHQGEIVQHGSAAQIYTNPANSFVASFMGNFNLLNTRQSYDLLKITDNKKIAIRPEAIYINPNFKFNQQLFSYLKAKIVKSQLLGNIVRYTIDINGIVLYVDELYRSLNFLYKEGQSIAIAIDLNEIKAVN